MECENDCVAGPSRPNEESDNERDENSKVQTVKRRRIAAEDVKKQWNLVKLYQRISDEPLAVKFAEELGLLPNERRCSYHKCPMPIYTKENAIGVFQCNKKGCRGKKKISRASGTWFERAHVPVSRIFFLMYSFARKFSYDIAQVEDFTSSTSCVSTRTIADWYSYCREVIVDYFLENQEAGEKIGGPGRVVQIDESKFERRKANKGHRFDGHWVLGMIEDGSEDLRLEICSDTIRNADVLVPLIKKHVHVGSIIHTNNWHPYACLSEHGFIHKKLNNSNPDNSLIAEDGSNNQRIDLQWRVVKKAFYKDNYKQNFSDWIIEYQWRRNVKNLFQDPFDELVKAIRFSFSNFKSDL